jgi:hypothetical protein
MALAKGAKTVAAVFARVDMNVQSWVYGAQCGILRKHSPEVLLGPWKRPGKTHYPPSTRFIALKRSVAVGAQE